jgi:NADPH-dependent curcumin reductase CurA
MAAARAIDAAVARGSKNGMAASVTHLRNRVWRLLKHPVGEIRPSDIELREEPVAPPGEGEVLLKHNYLSVDPAQRVYMNDAITLHEKAGGMVSRGAPLHGWAVGEVIASNSSRFPPGSYARDLYGEAGVREYSTLPASQLISVDPAAAPLPAYLSMLGLPGLTAYFGMLDVGRPKAGETVVVSAAGGAVGSIAGQIAKIQGCRVVGITGGPSKRRYLTENLGFDAAIDRDAGDLREALLQACPDGIDVFFDNVAGEILNECLAQMRQFGRIVFCGATPTYNAAAPLAGPSNYNHILLRALRWQAFSVPYYDRLFGEAVEEMKGWMAQGRLTCRYDESTGIETFPECLAKLFSGKNFGKVLIKVEHLDR